MPHQVKGAPNLLRHPSGQIVLPCQALSTSRLVKDPMLIPTWLCMARSWLLFVDARLQRTSVSRSRGKRYPKIYEPRMLPAVMYNDGLSACRSYARWHFSIPSFGSTKPSHISIVQVSIDRLLILETLQRVLPILGSATPYPAGNTDKAKISLHSVASTIQSRNQNDIPYINC